MASTRKRHWVSKKTGKTLSGWVVDYRDQLGRRKVKQFRSKADATAWLEGTNVHAIPAPPIQKTVSEAAQAWLERAESNELERSTLENYKWVLGTINPLLGHILVDQLTTEQIVIFRKQLAADKTPEMARRSVHYLKMVLNYAVDCGWATRNVASKLKASPSARQKMATRRNDLQIPTVAHLRSILKACDRQTRVGQPRMRLRTRLALLVLIVTGMRPSEMRGLPWRCVNLKTLQIRISQRADKYSKIGPCKTTAAYRTLPIGPRLAAELETWRKVCPPSEGDLVFPTRNGTPLGHRCLMQDWETLKRTAGLKRARGNDHPSIPFPRYRLYDLRHLRASWWIFERLDLKSLTTRLGHSSIQMTFDTYGHLITDAEKELVLKTSLEEALYMEATPTQHDIPDLLAGDENS